MSEKTVKEKQKPNFIEAVSMLLVLLAAVVVCVKADINIIPAMIVAIVWALIIAMKCGYTYNEIMEPVWDRCRGVVEIFLIILAIGMFVGAMIYSGTIPTIIYYLIKIVSPAMIVVLSFLLTTIVGIIIGTSWGTAGTVGVIMLSIAASMNVPMAIVAGAIASGTHVGQLCSPMSDTSNVCANFAEVDTMTMIKRMAYYTVPTIVIATVLYLVLGLGSGNAGASLEQVDLIRKEISTVFNTNPLVILPMVFVFFLTFKKKPILPTLTLASLVGVLFGMVFNHFSFVEGLHTLYNGFSLETTAGLSAEGFSDIFLNLVNRGGAMSMINAALIIIVATVYGTILYEVKAVNVIADVLFKHVKSRPAMCLSTIVVAGLVVALTSSSFLAEMMPKDLFGEKFKENGADLMDLVSSEATASTQFLTCIPWCDTAIFLAGLSGVPTLQALPYNFFGWGCAVMALILSVLGIGWKSGKRFFALNSTKTAEN